MVIGGIMAVFMGFSWGFHGGFHGVFIRFRKCSLAFS